MTRTHLLTQAIIGLRNEWPETPQQINSGYCADFATVVWERLKGPEWLLTLGTPGSAERSGAGWHVWLFTDGLHFDAECPQGVADWSQLPIFQRNRGEGWGGPTLADFADIQEQIDYDPCPVAS